MSLLRDAEYMGNNMVRTICRLAVVTLLTACGSVQYTVDDGRHVNEAMLANIRALGMGEQAIRPAIARASTPKPTVCETQWELPFAVASSDGLEIEDRIAWVRALKVDERLTVIASTPESALVLGDRIVEIDGYHSNNGEKMINSLMELRDDGRPFQIKTAEGRPVRITPLQVCRGHVTIALPSKPAAQDYHWKYSTHPLEVFQGGLTRDEALWVVLWTQGLSEEGGVRMKAYQYGLAPLRFLVGAAAVVTGVGAVANAAQSAGAASAGAAAASEAGFQIAKNIATDQAVGVVQQQMMTVSSKNRDSLEGVSWAAGTAFGKADKWSFERMQELGADPLAAITLHQKLVKTGSAANAFVLDAERMSLFQATAKSAQLDTQMAHILSGEKHDMGEQGAGRITTQLTANVTPNPKEEDVGESLKTDRITPQLTINTTPKPEENDIDEPLKSNF